MFGNETFAQQGWQCPICKRVYSPTTCMCFYCGNSTVTTSTNVTVDLSKLNISTDPETPVGDCNVCE